MDTPPQSPRPEPERLRTVLKDVVAWFVHEIRESGSANILEKELIDPLLNGVLNKLLPYIVTSSVVFLVAIAGIIIGIAWAFPKVLGPVSNP